jgi:hypothetical protein
MDGSANQSRTLEGADGRGAPGLDHGIVVEELSVARTAVIGPDDGERRLVRRLAQLVVVFAVGCSVGLGIGAASHPVSATPPTTLDLHVAPLASDGPAARILADVRATPGPGCSVVAATGHLTTAGEDYLAMHGAVPPAMPWFVVPTTPLVQRCVSPLPPFPVHEMPVRQASSPLLP